VYLLVFHAYINEMHSPRSKIPSKKSRPYIYIKFLALLGAPYIYDISRLTVNVSLQMSMPILQGISASTLILLLTDWLLDQTSQLSAGMWSHHIHHTRTVFRSGWPPPDGTAWSTWAHMLSTCPHWNHTAPPAAAHIEVITEYINDQS
jgi:hypothetical protein